MKRRLVLASSLLSVASAGFARAEDSPGAAADLTEPAPDLGPAPTNAKFEYSPYETETIAMVLKKRGMELEPSPEGKTIEAVVSERLDVFERRDFLPNFLRFVNALHATSKSYVIEREVLTTRGEAYRQVAIDESARNLRALPQLSLVLVVAVKGTKKGSVRVLVITKDVWSLRWQWDIAATDGGLERLIFQPAETNLAGIHHEAGLNFFYQPLSTALGTYYLVPRILSSRVAVGGSVNGIVNNPSGDLEGSFGSLSIGQPLWSTKTEWAWSVSGQWRNEVTRRYSHAALATFDSKLTSGDDKIPDEYRSDLAQARAAGTHSWGWKRKNDLIASFEASHSRYQTDDLSRFDPVAAKDYVTRRVPVSDDRVYPALEWRSYTTDYLSVLDLATLGLQEDYQLGHYFDIKAYPVSKDWGSSQNFLGVFAEAGYTLPLKDGLVSVDVKTTTEAQYNKVFEGIVQGSAFIATPRTPIGRLVWSGYFIDRYANYLNQTSVVGGNNRLRGYPTSYFFGKDAIASNLEYRSRPIEILKVQLGGVLFYDVGDAFSGWENLRPSHAVGVGFRALLPQFDRIVFRADLGVPISATPLPAGVMPVSFFVTFQQALLPQAFGSPSQTIGTLTGGR